MGEPIGELRGQYVSRISRNLSFASQLTLASLFNNPLFSDVKIKQVCDGKVREYFAHKAILCAENRYFLKLFTSNFKVGRML